MTYARLSLKISHYYVSKYELYLKDKEVIKNVLSLEFEVYVRKYLFVFYQLLSGEMEDYL